MNVEEKVLAYHQKRLEKYMSEFDYCEIIKTETRKKELSDDIVRITVKTLLMTHAGVQAFETQANITMGK